MAGIVTKPAGAGRNEKDEGLSIERPAAGVFQYVSKPGDNGRGNVDKASSTSYRRKSPWPPMTSQNIHRNLK